MSLFIVTLHPYFPLRNIALLTRARSTATFLTVAQGITQQNKHETFLSDANNQ